MTLSNLYKVRLVSLMWDFDHNNLPACFNNLFTYINTQTLYESRAATSWQLSSHTFKMSFGEKSFATIGTKTLNEIKSNELYKKWKTKPAYIKNYKQTIR